MKFYIKKTVLQEVKFKVARNSINWYSNIKVPIKLTGMNTKYILNCLRVVTHNSISQPNTLWGSFTYKEWCKVFRQELRYREQQECSEAAKISNMCLIELYNEF